MIRTKGLIALTISCFSFSSAVLGYFPPPLPDEFPPGPPEGVGGSANSSIATCASVYIGEFNGLHLYETVTWDSSRTPHCGPPYGTGLLPDPPSDCGPLTCDATGCGCTVGAGGGDTDFEFEEIEGRLQTAYDQLIAQRVTLEMTKPAGWEAKRDLLVKLINYTKKWQDEWTDRNGNTDEQTEFTASYNDEDEGHAFVLNRIILWARVVRAETLTPNFVNRCEDIGRAAQLCHNVPAFRASYVDGVFGSSPRVQTYWIKVEIGSQDRYFRVVQFRILGRFRADPEGRQVDDGQTLPHGHDEFLAIGEERELPKGVCTFDGEVTELNDFCHLVRVSGGMTCPSGLKPAEVEPAPVVIVRATDNSKSNLRTIDYNVE